MSFYHIKSSPKSNKGMFPKILVADIKKIPIKIATQEKINKISLLVERNLQNYSEQNDCEIDELVYEIYGITPDDKIIIDREFN